MPPVFLVLGALAGLTAVVIAVARPTRTVLPLFAAAVPAGSVVQIELPIPAPFNTLSSLLGTGAVFAVVGHVLVYRRGRVPTLAVAWWTLLAAWVSLTLFWAIEPAAAFDLALVVWPLVALIVVVSILPPDPGALDAMRVAIISSGGVIGLYAMTLLFSGAGLSGAPEGRFVITGASADTDPNILAASLLLPLGLGAERLLLGGSRWWRPAVWRAMGAMGSFLSMLAIVSTGSRGGVLSGLATFALVLWVVRRRPEARRVIRRTLVAIAASTLAIAVAASVSLRLDPNGPVHRLLTQPPLGRLPKAELGGSGRLEIWQTGLVLCKRDCAVGSGLGTFPTGYNQANAFAGSSRYAGWDRPAHSIFIDMAVEAGMPGLTLLLLALGWEWRALLRSGAHQQLPAVAPVLLGVLVANVFLSTLWFKYFWLVLVMIRLAEQAARASPVEAGMPVPAARSAPRRVPG